MAGKVTDAVAKLAIVVAAAILGGCNTDGNSNGSNEAISNFLVGEYANIEVVELQLGAETYRVYDKPSANKMIITKPMGWVLVHGSGWTPKEPFEAAALQHLANTGRSSCRMTEASVIIGPKHEIKYDCRPASAAGKRPKA
jgi:hypothetical protein